MASASSATDDLLGILSDAIAALSAAGVDTPELDAQLLLAEAAGITRERLFAKRGSFSEGTIARFGEMVARRAAREPIAYIIGRKEFFSLDFEVNPSVLIPRPETELLVASALELISVRPETRVLDLGTGCGAIAIAVAVNAPRVEVVATDISQAALEVSRRNAERLGCAMAIDFRRGDLWDALDGHDAGFDLVLSNPPYIRDGEWERLEPEISRFEPRVALAAGADGLGLYRAICAGLRRWIRPEGTLIVEVGAGQAASVTKLCRSSGARRVVTRRDLGGIERAVIAGF